MKMEEKWIKWVYPQLCAWSWHTVDWLKQMRDNELICKRLMLFLLNMLQGTLVCYIALAKVKLQENVMQSSRNLAKSLSSKTITDD